MKFAIALIVGILGLSVKASDFDTPVLVEEPGNRKIYVSYNDLFS